jgi:hypothetical protein
MAQPAPRDRADRQPEPKLRERFQREHASEAQHARPLTEERIAELGDGGPWRSDQEFETWLRDLATSREPESCG